MSIKDKNYLGLSGIYQILNLVNKKFYIGCSINLKKRLERHKSELKCNKHSNKHLQRAWNKHGSSKFKFIILEQFDYISIEDLLNVEKCYIIKTNCIKFGYNQMLDNSSFITKYNKKKSTIQANCKRRSKKVKAFNRFNGKFYKEFNSITEAAYDIKTSSSNISRVCKGTLNYAKDYVFCYSEDYDKTKNYVKKHWTQEKGLSKKHQFKLKKHMQATFGKKTFKYDLNHNFVKEYISIAEAERDNNFKKEFLKRKIDKQTPFGGNYYYSNKI